MRGGARPGAGRRKGTENKRTVAAREAADAIIAAGLTPLEVMLTAMRNKYEAGDETGAANIAKDAAPYVHPKLAQIEHSGRDGGPIPVQLVGVDASL